MAIRWSPGCGCCGGDPCNNRDVRFTPTSKLTRGNFAEWKPSFVYKPGETFAHYRIGDGRICEWQTPGPMQSATGWTTFEETRYTLLQVLDYVDDVEEWELYGSGWDTLTPEQKADYIIKGRLAGGMGYVSKEDVIADVKNFSVYFRPMAVQLPESGTLEAFAAVSLDDAGKPDSYFLWSVENVGVNNDPQGPGTLGNWPNKNALERVEAKSVAETYDIAWQQGSFQFEPTGYSVRICRKAEIEDGFYNGTMSIGAGGTLDIRSVLTSLGLLTATRINGYSWKITNGPGTLVFDDGSLPVQGGEVITQINEADPYKISSWLIRDPADIPTYDVLSSGVVLAPNPDEFGAITGKRIGLYVASGFTPGTAYNIDLFAGAAVSNAGSLAYDICPVCRAGTNCPCEDESDYPVFATLQQGVDFLEYQNFGPLIPPQLFIPQGVYGPLESIGSLGSSINRVSICEFHFYRMHAFSQTVTRTSRPSFRGRTITYLWEDARILIQLQPQMLVEIITRSEVRVSKTDLYLQNDTSTPIPLPTPAEALALVGGSVESAITALTAASGNAASGSTSIWPIDLADFSCKSFIAQGTYTYGFRFAGRPTNSWIGDAWVIASG